MRIIFLSCMIFISFGCAQHAATDDLYSANHLSAPQTPDLESIFLSLPPSMVAQMPVSGRRIFIHDARSESSNHRFDPINKYIHYFTDGEDGTGATSMLYLKVFASTEYDSVVLIHAPKPLADNSSPSETYTYILGSSDGVWIDITDQILPDGIKRNWYFRPSREGSAVETAPYTKIQRRDGLGFYLGSSEDKRELLFNNDTFSNSTPSGNFVYE